MSTLNKRYFLTAASLACAGVLPAPPAQAAPAMRSPGLLTVTGAIGRGNRGPVDPALDQMLVKQRVTFDRAHVFEALSRLPAATIRPTLEYDAQAHTLKGPLLTEVVLATGAQVTETTQLVLRAVDGYTVTLPWVQARRQRFMVATHLDGRPMALGGLGPLWAVFDADRDAQSAALALSQRFAACPWGLYHLAVQAG